MPAEVGLAECGLPRTLLVQQRCMLADLRFGVESAARVVEIDVALRVQAPVLRGTQRVQALRTLVVGKRRQELGECGVHGLIIK